MQELSDFFKNKKNLVGLLVLGILVLALSLTAKFLQEQRIIKSRATEDHTIVFTGSNVEQKNGKWVVKDSNSSISVQLNYGAPPPSR